MASIRVMVADDHAVLRAGLRLLINTQPDMTVVAEAGTFAEVLAGVAAHRPDVVTLDLTMPGGPAADIIAELASRFPSTKTLVLTMHDDAGHLRGALSAGASGYLVKKAADTELLNAIRAVYQGRTFVDVPLGHVPQPSRQDPKLLECLSEREREVFDLVAHGHTSQAIADRIFLSVKTVETYRRRIMEKLRLRNRADLIHLAIEQGILGTARE